MKKHKKIIALDFDGVISNSVHDSMRTAVNTYLDFVSDHQLPVKKILAADQVDQFENTNPHFWNEFSRLMPFGNFAKDYYVFVRLLELGKSETVQTQEDFNQFKKTIPEKTLTTYNVSFYENRLQMQKEDPQGWCQIIPVFRGVPEAVQILFKKHTLAIATSKDRGSVDLLLKHYRLDSCFLSENILDKDFAESKRHHLIRFHEKLNIPFSQIHFVDDKVMHLLKVNDLGVNRYLASWGFNSQQEHEIARANGCRVIGIEDLKEL